MNAPLRRAALRIILVYRTVSDDAALVLAEVPPADLQALERARIRNIVGAVAGGAHVPGRRLTKAVERGKTIEEWAGRWRASTK